MPINLQHGKYMIISIIKEDERLSLYLARDESNHEFIVSEIRDLDLIGKYLPLFSGFADERRIVCFTENSYLYVLAHFYDGDGIKSFFRASSMDLRDKLSMLKNFSFGLISASELPEVIFKSLLSRENVVVYRGELQSNCGLITDIEKKPTELFYEILSCMFGKDEKQRIPFLGIIMQKLKNDVYSDFAEVYIDINELVQIGINSRSIIKKIKKLWEKYKPTVKILASVAILVLAAIVLHDTLMSGSQTSASATGKKLDHIGTVIFSGEKEDNTNEIQVRPEQ